MEPYKKELQEALNDLAEVSMALLEETPYSEDYSLLLLVRNDLLWKIQTLEDRRRQDYIQNREEDHD